LVPSAIRVGCKLSTAPALLRNCPAMPAMPTIPLHSTTKCRSLKRGSRKKTARSPQKAATSSVSVRTSPNEDRLRGVNFSEPQAAARPESSASIGAGLLATWGSASIGQKSSTRISFESDLQETVSKEQPRETVSSRADRSSTMGNVDIFAAGGAQSRSISPGYTPEDFKSKFSPPSLVSAARLEAEIPAVAAQRLPGQAEQTADDGESRDRRMKRRAMTQPNQLGQAPLSPTSKSAHIATTSHWSGVQGKSALAESHGFDAALTNKMDSMESKIEAWRSNNLNSSLEAGGHRRKAIRNLSKGSLGYIPEVDFATAGNYKADSIEEPEEEETASSFPSSPGNDAAARSAWGHRDDDTALEVAWEEDNKAEPSAGAQINSRLRWPFDLKEHSRRLLQEEEEEEERRRKMRLRKSQQVATARAQTPKRSAVRGNPDEADEPSCRQRLRRELREAKEQLVQEVYAGRSRKRR